MRPKVSVILPSLNMENYIRECVESVLTQTMEEIEVICVDAGSEDGTCEIIEDYARRDGRVVVLQSIEKSYGKQVNMGIEFAQGEYIAIVETDDFIARDMYECLYDLAEKSDADYVKADFDFYITLHNGGRLYKTEKLFPGKGLYGTVITPEEHMELFVNDSAIWKGIYSRDFLQKNHIRFHESKGAAFQDIGFMMQVLCHAKRAVYTGHSFYRYCRDREGASSNQPDSLRYVYQEFCWLLDGQIFNDSIPVQCWKGVYRRMADSFLCESDKIIRRADLKCGRVEKEEIHYRWLQNKLTMAMEKGILEENDFPSQIWFELNLIIYSFKGYLDYSYVKYKMTVLRECRLLKEIANRRVVIFGYGAYGFELYQLLDRNGVEVLVVCDNNVRLWGTKVGEVELESPHECIERYKEEVFVIANKYYAHDIYSQLLMGGIKPDNIIRYIV